MLSGGVERALARPVGGGVERCCCCCCWVVDSADDASAGTDAPMRGSPREGLPTAVASAPPVQRELLCVPMECDLLPARQLPAI